MSISSIGSGISGFSPEMMQQMQSNRQPPPPDGGNPEEFAANLISENDSDGDSLLSIDESGLDDEQFSAIDSDGDGQLSSEEILSDMKSRHEEMMAKMESSGQLTMQMAGFDMTSGLNEQSSTSSDSSSSEEEYDELDLNQDGIVSMQERMQSLMGDFLSEGQENGLTVKNAMSAYASASAL